MDFPADLISAETRIADDLASVDTDVCSLAITGRTKNLYRLATFRQLSSLWVAGCGAGQLKTIAGLSHLERLVIHDMRVAELRPLAVMTRLKALVICGNARAVSLAGIDLLGQLEILALENLQNVRSINPLAALGGLRFLSIEGSMHSAMVIDTLKPLARLVSLEQLRLANLRVTDRSLAPVAELKQLQRLFIANMFEVEEFARLSAALTHTEGEALRPYWATSILCEGCEEKKVLLTGEGQPAVCPACDPDRVAAHVERFDRIKQAASGHG